MKTEKKQYGWLRVLIFVILAVFGVILRSIFVTNIAEFPILINNALILENTNFSMHMITMEYIYTSIFSVFFSFVGNKVELAIYFQIILQVLAIVLLYFSIKKITNKICAWICYIVFICIPFAFSISINQLFFMFFSIVFAISALYIHIISKVERSLTAKWISSLLIALIFTHLVILDSIYIVFLIFGLLLAILYSNSAKEMLIKTKLVSVITYIFGIVISLVIYFSTKIFMGKEKDLTICQKFINDIFIVNSKYTLFFKDLKVCIQKDQLLIYCIVGFFVLFMILSFFQKTRKNSIVIIVLFLSLSLYWMFFETVINPFMVIVALAWIIFVLGVQGLISLVQDKKEIIEIIMQEEPIEVPIEELQIKEKIEPVAIKKNNYIENPLPVPKKHIPKVLDYRFDPRPEDMHYDLDN